MASAYYGQRGGVVTEWQKRLNELGAGLSVDGVWGDKTEAAYNSLLGQPATAGASVNAGGAVISAGGAAAGLPDVSYLKADAMSDDELRKIATEQGRASYELEQRQLRSEYDRDVAAKEKQRSRIESDYGDTAAAIEEAFGVKRDELSDYALARGMGRSSYALDMQQRAFEQERSQLLSALTQKQRAVEDIDDSLAVLNEVLSEGMDKLSRTRLDSIEALVMKLKKEQQQAVIDAQKYNNELILKLQEIAAAQQQAAMEAMNAGSGSSGSRSRSGGSSGGSKSNGAAADYFDTVMSEWNRLTPAGKLTYFNRNSAYIKRNDSGLYTDLKWQYDELKKSTRSQNESYSDMTDRKYYSGGR